MAKQTAVLLKAALKLSNRERARLAASLLESLDIDLGEEYDHEIQRRIAEIDRGIVKPIPWEKARKMIFGP
ncbi:MAG: addiction module protein [Gemmataceae bacterium]|nr:addiction module protein [Gemmataceae bacterium]MCI0737491.1 addiction module protein [Gemmataceae bacterium]